MLPDLDGIQRKGENRGHPLRQIFAFASICRRGWASGTPPLRGFGLESLWGSMGLPPPGPTAKSSPSLRFVGEGGLQALRRWRGFGLESLWGSMGLPPPGPPPNLRLRFDLSERVGFRHSAAARLRARIPLGSLGLPPPGPPPKSSPSLRFVGEGGIQGCAAVAASGSNPFGAHWGFRLPDHRQNLRLRFDFVGEGGLQGLRRCGGCSRSPRSWPG